MSWWNKNKWKVIAPLLIVVVLAAAFWYGGGAPGMQGWQVTNDAPAPAVDTASQNTPDGQTAQNNQSTEDAASKPGPDQAPDQPDEPSPADVGAPAEAGPPAGDDTPLETVPAAEGDSPDEGIESRPGGLDGGMSASEKIAAAAELGGSDSDVPPGDKDYSEAQGMVIDPITGKDKYLTDPVPEGKPLPVEPQDAVFSDTIYTCTLSVRCDTILDNMDWLDPEKVELVPEDGVIFPSTQVTFYEGESVFNVLQREMKKAKIHMEFSDTPMYNSAYIEGINNLYEFDCGELSGWMYKVNGWFPNYGCSRYQLQDGDVVEWVYTCTLGKDVGGFSAVGG